jgi:hypothetical protein
MALLPVVSFFCAPKFLFRHKIFPFVTKYFLVYLFILNFEAIKTVGIQQGKLLKCKNQ